MSQVVPVFAHPSPQIQRVALDRPWAWLGAGWKDLTRTPQVSLAYGAVLVAISWALTLALAFAGWVYVVLPLIAGFFLVAPVLAVGLYETSRRLALNLPVTLADSLAAWRRNGTQIAYLGLVLMLINLAWVRIATLLFALFFYDRNPGWDGLINALLFSSESLPFLLTGAVIGAGLAALVFAIGAVSIPMLLDRDVNVFTAIATSWMAVQINWKPMALWAALIVVFTGLGLVTFYIGLAVVLPLIGHATWHAYRDLVV
jgi:uncharacterized membrane protein